MEPWANEAHVRAVIALGDELFDRDGSAYSIAGSNFSEGRMRTNIYVMNIYINNLFMFSVELVACVVVKPHKCGIQSLCCNQTT